MYVHVYYSNAVCFRDTHLFYPQVPCHLCHFEWNQLPQKQVHCPGVQSPEHHLHLLISRQYIILYSRKVPVCKTSWSCLPTLQRKFTLLWYRTSNVYIVQVRVTICFNFFSFRTEDLQWQRISSWSSRPTSLVLLLRLLSLKFNLPH